MSYNVTEVQLISPVADIKDVANYRTYPLILESALIGIFTVQTAYFVQQRCSHLSQEAKLPDYMKTKRKPYANLLVALAICLYLLAVGCWAIDVAILHIDLTALLPNEVSEVPDPEVYTALADLRGGEMYAQAVLQVVIWSISDCVTLWRAYVVFERPRWLKFTIISVLFLEFANYVVYLTLYLYALAHPPQFVVSLWQTSGGLIGTAPFVSTSAVTASIQVFASLLITYKARAIIKRRRGMLRGPGRNFRTLSVLIESSVAYTMLWIWYTIGANHTITSNETAEWTDFYVIPLTAMYPTLVMMIVTVQDSVLADNADNLPDDTSSFQLTMPSHNTDIVADSEGPARGTLHKFGRTSFTGSKADEGVAVVEKVQDIHYDVC